MKDFTEKAYAAIAASVKTANPESVARAILDNVQDGTLSAHEAIEFLVRETRLSKKTGLLKECFEKIIEEVEKSKSDSNLKERFRWRLVQFAEQIKAQPNQD